MSTQSLAGLTRSPATLSFESEPVDPAVKAVRVVACMSMPRLCFSDNMFSVMWLPSMNVPVRKACGAYWEQSVSRLWYKAVEEKYDYILQIDYDSLFQPVDFHYLLRLMATQEDAAAIFGVQFRRGVDQIICGGAEDIPILGGHLQPAEIGHFALTLIRVSALKQLPHPWLHSQPNAEGLWEVGKVDADIYFWKKLRAHGLKAYVAPRLVIGHAQLMATWPGDGLKPRHQYIGNYLENGDLPDDVKDAALERTMKEAAE